MTICQSYGKKVSLVFCFGLALLACAEAASGGQFVSDDFSGGLNTDLWTFVDPRGNCSLNVADGVAEIHIPGDIAHDAWIGGNTAPRIMQAIDNNDFDIVAKYESRPSVQFQMQGILVEQDTGNFLRCDVYYDGTNDRLFVASFSDGTPTILADQVIEVSSIYYLKVTRSGDHFVCSISYDGLNWQVGTEFDRLLSVGHAGVFAGNAGFSIIPAFVCRVDYAFNSKRPIVPEDGQQKQFALSVNIQGVGQVVKTPGPCICGPDAIVSPAFDLVRDCNIDFFDFAVMASLWLNEGQSLSGDITVDGVVDFADMEVIADSWLVSYMPSDCNDANATSFYEGQQVELLAIPGDGSSFVGWSGSISDANNPTSITMQMDYAIEAIFVSPDIEPPVISDVVALPRDVSAVITWQTDEPATSSLIYGLDPNYSDGEISDDVLVTQHTAELAGLLQGAKYYCLISGLDAAGNEGFYELSFTTDSNDTLVVSDDFVTGQLDETIWRFINPLGDVNLAMSGTAAVISVPAGADHDIWTAGIKAPRLVQNINDINFDVQVKFISPVLLKYQMQGLLVEESDGSFLRYDVYSDGSHTFIFGANFIESQPYLILNEITSASAPYFLRVKRNADQWELLFSTDGMSWALMSAFSRSMAVKSVGFFGANAGSTNIPALTSVADYFFNSNSPIFPEDGEYYALTTEVVGSGQVSRSPEAQWYAQGQEVELTAIGDPNWHFVAWEGEGLGGNSNPMAVVVEGETLVRAHFVQTSLEPQIDLWYGTEQHFGYNGAPQRWINILGNIGNSDNVSSLSFSLNGSPQRMLSMGSGNPMDPYNNPRLIRKGDFNIEIAYDELLAGSNEVVITALDMEGQPHSKNVIANYHWGNAGTLPLSIDWQSISQIEDAAQIVDGKWSLTSSGPRITEAGYDRSIAIGDVNWTDYEVVVPITVHESFDTGQEDGPGFGIVLRWPGHRQWDPSQPDQPCIGWWPFGALVMYSWTDLAANEGSFDMRGTWGMYLAEGPTQLLEYNVKYFLKMRVTTIDGIGVLYQFMAWKESETEPSEWLLEFQQDLSSYSHLQSKGALLIVGHYVDATVGNISVTPLP